MLSITCWVDIYDNELASSNFNDLYKLYWKNYFKRISKIRIQVCPTG